ncbi:MAG: serine O-acetyltransferase [Cellvibrionales bacterium TMED49]|nr:serine O-acetyltransferase [Porticoccaceae bacterium]OUU39355.1 MAG: serine O-acetyltransferase [Cellvibrionales bacterium TMED49]
MLEEARIMQAQEPALRDFLEVQIFKKPDLGNALADNLSSNFFGITKYEINLEKIFAKSLDLDNEILQCACRDLQAYVDRDPACEHYVTPLLFYKGFQALQLQRICHSLWIRGQRYLARYLQSKMSENYGVDIHPGAIIGAGVMLDHATSLVIGETAVVGDDVSILHSVTLGGSGLQSGDRHPKIANGVLIAAGAKVLGNITVGEGVKIGAGSLVLESVPAFVTVAGVPAKIIGGSTPGMAAFHMDQQITKEGN